MLKVQARTYERMHYFTLVVCVRTDSGMPVLITFHREDSTVPSAA